MITSDFKNGVYQNKAAKCATSKRAISRAEMFIVDTFIGLLGAAILLTPILCYIYL